MTYQMSNNHILYVGFIRDIADPGILNNILAHLQDGDVVGEYLNRVIGGVTCEIIPQSEVADEFKRQDPTRTLKATYSRSNLEIRIAELQRLQPCG